MFVHRSNRMEVLVDELAHVLQRPMLRTLEPETIIIQTPGMERWLGRELAERLGTFANARFPYPRAFIESALAAVLGPQEGTDAFSRESLMWTLVELLGELRDERALEPLRAYVADDADGLRRFQLAQRIASLFDQYVIYRPEMVLGWENGVGSDWQAVLFRALVSRLGSVHFAARAQRFIQEFSPLFVQRGALPARVSLVGGATLPPQFLRLLGRIAEASEVHLFALSPTQTYLGQLQSRRASERRAAPLALSGGEVHPLLASLASVAGGFQQVLESTVAYVDGAAQYVNPGRATVLSRLQSELLEGRKRDDLEPLPRTVDDESISLVSCHSALREVEVLRDRLLSIFDERSELRPDDVVVMVPDIGRYAPLIEAVFDVDSRDVTYLPYRIADRSEENVNQAAKAFLRVLDVLSSRFKASQVLDLLQLEPIRRRFGLAPVELPRIQRWVHDAGIRWGVDGAHRAEHGLPVDATNTWEFGLRRLLLGYALSDNELTTFEGVVPHDDSTGTEAELLGRFVDFCTQLFSFRAQLRVSRSMEAWRQLFDHVIAAFVSDDAQGEWSVRPLYDLVHRLVERARVAGFDQEVSLQVLRALLEEGLHAERQSTDFLSGGVTFCELLPLRSIPFPVVAVLGLDDGEFPRIETPLGFDKMAEKPRAGDRSLRDDDRYLFLETLLSARERLLLSYVGRGIQDNEVRPPSVVVSELAAAVGSLFEGEGDKPWLSAVEHPLQPFSARYFDGSESELFSYGQKFAEGARAHRAAREAERPFFSGCLALGEAPDVVVLDELVRFLENPAKAFLQGLGIFLRDEPELVEDREPVLLDGLDRYRVGARLLGASPADDDEREQLRTAELARGVLPRGAPGAGTYRELELLSERIRSTAEAFMLGAPEPPRSLDLAVSVGEREVRLQGALPSLVAGTLVDRRFSRISARHELGLWVRHLAACGAGIEVAESVLVGRDSGDGIKCVRFRPVPQRRSIEVLSSLIELYELGRTRALPLFPSTSLHYVEALHQGSTHESALEKAQRSFGSDWGFDDAADPHVQQAFRGTPPFEVYPADFATFSSLVFEPLLEHRAAVDAGKQVSSSRGSSSRASSSRGST